MLKLASLYFSPCVLASSVSDINVLPYGTQSCFSSGSEYGSTHWTDLLRWIIGPRSLPDLTICLNNLIYNCSAYAGDATPPSITEPSEPMQITRIKLDLWRWEKEKGEAVLLLQNTESFCGTMSNVSAELQVHVHGWEDVHIHLQPLNESVTILISPISYTECSSKTLEIWFCSLNLDQIRSSQQFHWSWPCSEAQALHTAAPAPLQIKTIDGESIRTGVIVLCSKPLLLQVSALHVESISFLVTTTHLIILDATTWSPNLLAR